MFFIDFLLYTLFNLVNPQLQGAGSKKNLSPDNLGSPARTLGKKTGRLDKKTIKV